MRWERRHLELKEREGWGGVLEINNLQMRCK